MSPASGGECAVGPIAADPFADYNLTCGSPDGDAEQEVYPTPELPGDTAGNVLPAHLLGVQLRRSISGRSFRCRC